MIYTVKHEGETNEKMILRYKKLFFQSRIANKIRAERYANRPIKKKKIEVQGTKFKSLFLIS